MKFSIDTNVFVYLTDDRDIPKQEIARDLIEAALVRDTWIGLQVVGELQSALRRRLRKTQLEAAGSASFVRTAFPSFAYDETDVSRALLEMIAGRFAYWDALLLSAASRAGCDVVFSEDMSDGGLFDALTIINPFGRDRRLSDGARKALSQ